MRGVDEQVSERVSSADPEGAWMLKAGFLKAPPVPTFEPEAAPSARRADRITAEVPASAPAKQPSPAPIPRSEPGRRSGVGLKAAPGPSQPSTGEKAPRSELAIVLYGLPSCSVCQAARRHLEQRGLPFVEHDVGRDSAAAARALRLNPRRIVPTIDLGGREVLLGFTREEFDAALVRALLAVDRLG